jgi:hypothetical protein
MTVNKRAKGLAAEREVAEIWKAHGLEVRNLEGSGDHLIVASDHRRVTGAPPKALIHSEVKRQERMKLWEWLAQAEKEAPANAIPVVSFRRTRGRWYACLPLEDLAELLS